MKPHYNRDVAAARFAAVTIAEIFALGICTVPLWSRTQQWQQDCFKVGLLACVPVVLLLLVALVVAVGAPRNRERAWLVRFFEIGIVLLFVFNVVALALVTARSGGPTSSPYGTLIPTHLSAILFLQLQKDRLTGESSRLIALAYFCISVGGYLAAYFGQDAIIAVRVFTADSRPVDYAAQNATAMIWLTVGAMLLSFATYSVPSDERVRDWVGNLFPPHS